MKILILILAALLTISCQKQQVNKIVKYEILTAKGCKFEYINQFGSTYIDSTKKSVYKALFEVEENQNFFFIKAISTNQFNSIICRMYIDGEIVKQSTLSGVGSTNIYFKVR